MLSLCALSALVCCGGGRGGGWFADLTFFPSRRPPEERGGNSRLSRLSRILHPGKKKNHLKRASDTKRIFKNRGREQQQGLFLRRGRGKVQLLTHTKIANAISSPSSRRRKKEARFQIRAFRRQRQYVVFECLFIMFFGHFLVDENASSKLSQNINKPFCDDVSKKSNVRCMILVFP